MTWLTRRRERNDAARQAIVAELRRPQETTGNHLIGERKSAARASLLGSDLHGADLRFADLRHCDLRRADLSSALFDGADLSWARLSGANLEAAVFGRALLVETVMDGANLAHADLSQATGLTWASVRGATRSTSTKWPTGFSPARPVVAGPLIHTGPRPPPRR